MRCLITGAGLLGSHIAKHLITSNHKVLVIDRESSLQLYLKKVCGYGPQFECVDICDGAQIEKIFQSFSPDAVLHTAGVMESYLDENVFEGAKINIAASIALIETAKKYSVEKFMFASSLAVYDFEAPEKPLSEAGPFTSLPEYGFAKKFVEDWLIRSVHETSMNSYILRYTGIIGIGQHAGGAWCSKMIQDMLEELLFGKEPYNGLNNLEMLGDNEYLHVEDAARATCALLTLDRSILTNVGNQRIITAREFYTALAEKFPNVVIKNQLSVSDDTPIYRKRQNPISITGALAEIDYVPQFLTAIDLIDVLCEELCQTKVLEGMKHDTTYS